MINLGENRPKYLAPDIKLSKNSWNEFDKIKWEKRKNQELRIKSKKSWMENLLWIKKKMKSLMLPIPSNIFKFKIPMFISY